MRKQYYYLIGILVIFMVMLTGLISVHGKSTESGEKSTTADPYKQKVKTGDKDKEFVRLMPNVTMEMQCADYWINKSDNPDEVIMSADGIKRFNNSILTEKSEFLKYSKLRENYNGGIISGIDLEKYLRETEIPAGECFVNGNEVDETYWDRLIDNENFEVIQDENQLQYGFATERASMRGFPTEDIVYTGNEFTFYDEIQMSSLLVGEPVIIAHESKDGKWLFVITQSCTGWTLAENVAISQNYDKWIKESDPARFLIVTEDEITLEYDPKNKLISEKKLTMGTKLPLVPITENTKSSEGRQAYGNYLVKIPSRSKDGHIKWEYAFVPISRGVNVGYVKLTQRNILNIAFDALGNRYGWGGMYEARDCSLYIMELYRCFGIILPRNTTGLAAMKSETVETGEMSDTQKEKILDDVQAGSILCMKGHVAVYLGRERGNYFTISASAEPIPDQMSEKVNVHSVIVNDLDIKRKDDKTWLSHIEKIKLIR